ncbi:MAG: hypothetical protein QOG53_3249 [Frankiales bacterium]|jgi:hypothetical protein|nr:hypothetical protein [Frankiales bacterium]
MRVLRLALAAAAAATTFGAVATATPAAAAPVIQPGSSLEFGSSFCTANWVYNGADGSTYLGSARHCTTGVGQQVDLATSSLGTPIQRIGQVAYTSAALDFLLIRVDPAVVPQVSAALAGHPNIPTGVSTTSTAAIGDVVQYSGHGVGFHLTTPTQQQRVGILGFNDGTQHYSYGAVTPGDSGGPVADVTDGNKALGIVDTVGVAVAGLLPQVGEGGVSLQALLADAGAHGFSITLRTV